MKYLKLFEDFDPINILTAPQQVVLSKESFDYLVGCLNYVSMACAGESKHLKSRGPIDQLVQLLVQYGNMLGFQVNKFSRHMYLGFEDCLEGAYNYLKAIDKFAKFTSEDDNTPSDFEKPTGELKGLLEAGLLLIEDVYNEFSVMWAGKLGEAPPSMTGGEIRRDPTIPHWK